MKRLNLFSLILAVFLFASLKMIAEPIQGSDKDTVWMQYTADMSYMVQISNTNKYIASFGQTHTFFYDFNSGKEINRIEGNDYGYFINNDLNFIRIGKDKKSVEILNTNSWENTIVIESQEHFSEYPTADISNDGKYMVITIDGGFEIFDIMKKAFIKTKKINLYENQTGLNLLDVKFNCEGNIIIQLAKTYKNDVNPDKPIIQGCFTVFDFQTLDSVDCLGNASNLAISEDCNLMAFHESSKPTDGVQIYNLNSKKLLWTLPTAGTNLTGMEFSPDNKYLLITHAVGGNSLDVWDLDNGKMTYQIKNYGFQAFDVSNDDKYFATTVSNYLVLWKSNYGTSVVENPQISNETIYPNPTNGLINLTFNIPSTAVTTISIVTSTGKTVKQLFNDILSQGTQHSVYAVNDLMAGSYFIRIQNYQYSKIFKLIINN